GGEEPAVVAVLHDLANAGGVEGDDGVAGGHGLGEDEALGLGGGGKGELGHGGVGVVEAVAGEFAGEDDAFGDAGLLEDGDHVVAAGAVADDEGAGFGEGVEGLGDGAREEAEVFFGGEAAEVADGGDVGGDVPAFAGAGGFAGGDLAGVDAGGDDVDGDGDAARDDQFAHALAGGDDGVAAVGEAGGDFGGEVAGGLAFEREVVGVVFVEGVVREEDGDLAAGGCAQGGVAEEAGVVGVDDVGADRKRVVEG